MRIAAGLMLLLVALVATAATRGQRLQDMQDAYAAAIRWNDFDTAWALVDPQYREAHPLGDLQRARYDQVQISGYKVLRAAAGGEDEVARDIELRVINRNTQAERTVRVREVWRWDPAAKQWWLGSGLPDLWQGE